MAIWIFVGRNGRDEMARDEVSAHHHDTKNEITLNFDVKMWIFADILVFMERFFAEMS